MANEGNRWGGSEPLWSSAATNLARKGNEVRVSAKEWGDRVPEVEALRGAGCQIFYRDDRLLPFFKRQVRRLMRVPDFRLKHLREVGEGVDLVVISQGSNDDGLVWIEATKAAGYRYAIVSQSAVVYWWPADDFADRLAKVHDDATATYFVSQANVELSRRQFGSPLRNAKVVRNPFNVRYDACPPWPEDSPVELALAFVARLDIISKGHDLLLDALSRPRWRERSIKVSFVGTGPHERALRRMVDQLSLKSVEFVGQKGDIEEIWRHHHALVLGSRFEGMPLVVVEAMLCGRPCIVTNVGGNAELIRDGSNGYLAPAATVDFIDEALNRAWENRSGLKEMGRTAAEDVRKWVSNDPGQDFATDLERLADSVSKTAGET
jgi:glycosyltransferase involved in cell wall biosynthesis